MGKVIGAILVGSLVIALAVLFSNGAFSYNKHQKKYGFESVLYGKFSDPDSVQLRNIIIDSNEPRRICGEVNAKNRLGGYVGYQRFLALDMTNLGRSWTVVIASEVANNFPTWCSE